MISHPHETRIRYEKNVDLGRDLARKLADEAVRIAETLERLAVFHDALTCRSEEAARHAASERRLAARERAASVWFLAIADGKRDAERSELRVGRLSEFRPRS